MAIQSLPIKDGTGSIQYLAVESGSYGYIPIHQVTSSITYPLYITASSASPLPITGTINVDVQVSDLLTVTSSNTNRVWVTGNVSVSEIVTVTSSNTNPVWITGSMTVNTASSEITITNTEANAVYVQPRKAQTVTLSGYVHPGWDTAESGTFRLAYESSSRKSLMIFNPGPNNLYIAMSTNGDSTNGFVISNTSQPPSLYSFIIYPSGTFVGDNTNLNVYYGGYFVSSSYNTVSITQIS